MLSPLIGNLIRFDFTAFPPGDCKVQEHLHAFHQLDVILHGSVDILVEGRGIFSLKAGDALFLPPLWRHCLSFTPKGFRQGSYKFYLGGSYFSSFPKEPVLLRMPPEVLSVIETSGVARGTVALQEQLAGATLALVKFARPSAAPADSPDPFRQRLFEVLKEVSDAPFRKWAILDLARLSGLGSEAFTRRFIALLGKSPRQFLVETKIRAAAIILATDPEVEIKAVAQSAGYETVHSFTRAFTRMTGATPGEVRKSAKIPAIEDKDKRRPPGVGLRRSSSNR